MVFRARNRRKSHPCPGGDADGVCRGSRTRNRDAGTNYGDADPPRRVHSWKDAALFSDRPLRCFTDWNGRDALVPGSLSRSDPGTARWSSSVPAVHAGCGIADLDRLRDSTTGDGDVVLLYYAGHNVLRLRIPNQHHAAVAAILHLSQPAALLPG